MQRDVYAALVKKRHKRRIPVSILQLNGRVTYEHLFDEVFFGYRSRRIALVTHTAGQDPALPRLPQDITVTSFDTLAQVHQPHFLYRLLPLKCDDVEAFAALQAVCGTAGSPFTIADRLDPQELTFRFHASSGAVSGAAPPCHRETIAAFFTPYLPEAERAVPLLARRMPIGGVEYQAALYRAARVTVEPAPGGSGTSQPSTHLFSAAALLTTHEAITESTIEQRAMMRDFAESSTFAHLRSNTDWLNAVYTAKHRWHIMAVKKPVGTAGVSRGVSRGREGTAEATPLGRAALVGLGRAALVGLARAKDIHIYERVGEGHYECVC